MKRLILFAGFGLALLFLTPDPGRAADFKVGDHVLVGDPGEPGTVIKLGQHLGDGGVMITIQLDRFGPPHAGSGIQYDTAVTQITLVGGGDAGGPPPGPPPPGAPPPPPPGPTPTGPPPGGQAALGGADAPPPPTINPDTQTSMTPALCQQLIRQRYTQVAEGDQTVTVNFLTFQNQGTGAYEAIYANDLPAPAARGHVVQALSAHAKYTVLVHYQNPNAPDELRTFDAQYKCYRAAASGDWTAEMISRLPGGETAQYIRKR